MKMYLLSYKVILIYIFIQFSSLGHSQSIYKTPSGKKYHLASCRLVENVSKKLVGAEDITTYGLTPCKICKPPLMELLVVSLSHDNKAMGESTNYQCMGFTKKGKRCKHRSRIANGYCYQHTK